MASFLAPILPPRRAITHSAAVSRCRCTAPAPATIVRKGFFNPRDLQRVNLDSACTDFSRHNAYALGVLSDAVYGDLDPERLLTVAQTIDPRFSRVFPFSMRNTQVAIFEHEACIAVIWRGSDGDDLIGSDWKDNFNYTLTNVHHVEGIPVQFHKGFWQHVQQAWDNDVDEETGQAREGVKTVLQRLLVEQTRKVFWSGHSLGASAAVLGAMRFLQEVGDMDGVAQIVTFGQPRSVHGKFADRLLSEKLGSRYFRFVNETDLVPHLPISVKFLHGGTLKLATIDKNVLTNPGVGTLLFRKFASFMVNLTELKFSVFGDHDIKLYWDVALNGKYVK